MNLTHLDSELYSQRRDGLWHIFNMVNIMDNYDCYGTEAVYKGLHGMRLIRYRPKEELLEKK